MKVDTAVTRFMESYNEEMMSDIDRLSRETGLVAHHYKMPAVNLQESFDQFTQYLEGYAKYKTENMSNPKASPQEKIRETTSRFCESLFKPLDLKYSDIPGFIASYLEGTQKLTSKVDELKSVMTEAGVDPSDIGDVNDFCDQFMEKADGVFYPLMEKFVRASGYTTRHALKRGAPKKETPVFL